MSMQRVVDQPLGTRRAATRRTSAVFVQGFIDEHQPLRFAIPGP